MERPGRRLAIAYVHYGAQSGVTEHVARALEERGHEVRLVAATGALEPRDPRTRWPRPSPDVLLHLAHAAVRFRSRALVHRWNTPFAFDRHSRAAGAALERLDPPPDVVLQNGALFAPGLPAPWPYVLLLDHTRALAMESPPVPEAGLEAPEEYGGAWAARETSAYLGASGIATFSRNVARSLVRHYGVEPERIRVVGAGANAFPPEAPRHDDGRTIAFIGRDWRRKGGPILAEAFVRVRRTNPRARLLVAGPRVRPPLPEGGVFLGAVPMDEVPALLSQATVFAMPTLREPFGIALLDAMACGVPCVAARVEAVPEIVRDGETGILAPPGDAAALAAGLAALLADPDRGRAMGARGRERVAAGFLWEHVAARLEDVLRAAAAAPTPTAGAPAPTSPRPGGVRAPPAPG